MKKLTVQQASEKYGSSVRAALLIDMTNVFGMAEDGRDKRPVRLLFFACS